MKMGVIKNRGGKRKCVVDFGVRQRKNLSCKMKKKMGGKRYIVLKKIYD